MTSHHGRPILTIAAVASTLVVSCLAVGAADHDELLEDDAELYRLVVTVDRESVAVGEIVPTRFCLSPNKAARMDICLGQFQGHHQLGTDRATTSFVLIPDREEICVCARPIVLESERPVCWPMSVEISDLGVERMKLSGFVTILENAREVGETAASCVDVDSDGVELTIRPDTDEESWKKEQDA
jgi:hypothetical protein